MSSEADSYQLVRCLRSTETSETHEATHPTAPGRFLVELFPSGLDAAALEAFEAELASLAEAAHPNILTVIGLGKLPDGKTTAIWELPGGTLAEWLHRGRAASPEAALGLVAGIAQALAAAHARGIAHERLTPENVYLVEDTDLGRGGVKLGGFGLRWLQPGGPAAGSGPDRRIAADLAGLADVAERLLVPLDLPAHRPVRGRGGVQSASQVITRGRGHGAGAPFGSAVEFAEALAAAVRAQVDEAAAHGFEALARPDAPGEADESAEARGERSADSAEVQAVSGEAASTSSDRRRRLGLMVARIGAATVGAVATVLVILLSVDPKKVPIPPEPSTSKPAVAQSVAPVMPSPPAAVSAPALPAPPAPSPTASADPPEPAEPPAAAIPPPAPAPHTPKVVTIGPPERSPRPPQRARRGLVWSTRLQRLVTVEQAAAEAALSPPPLRAP